MTMNELAVLVADMRLTQRDYFRLRTGPLKEQCRKKEHHVDAIVQQILDSQAPVFEEIGEDRG